MSEFQRAYSEFVSYRSSDIEKDLSGFMGSLSYLVEVICNEEPEALKRFLYEETKKDLFQLAPWLRLMIVQSIILKQSDDKEFVEWALGDLGLFYHPENQIIQALERRAKTLEQ